MTTNSLVLTCRADRPAVSRSMETAATRVQLKR